MPTDNQGFPEPQPGDTDYENTFAQFFDQIDRAVEIRDTKANRSNYDPKDSAKYLATDTGEVFVGNGSSWDLIPVKAPSGEFDTLSTDRSYINQPAGTGIIGESLPHADLLRQGACIADMPDGMAVYTGASALDDALNALITSGWDSGQVWVGNSREQSFSSYDPVDVSVDDPMRITIRTTGIGSYVYNGSGTAVHIKDTTGTDQKGVRLYFMDPLYADTALGDTSNHVFHFENLLECWYNGLYAELGGGYGLYLQSCERQYFTNCGFTDTEQPNVRIDDNSAAGKSAGIYFVNSEFVNFASNVNFQLISDSQPIQEVVTFACQHESGTGSRWIDTNSDALTRCQFNGTGFDGGADVDYFTVNGSGKEAAGAGNNPTDSRWQQGAVVKNTDDEGVYRRTASGWSVVEEIPSYIGLSRSSDSDSTSGGTWVNAFDTTDRDDVGVESSDGQLTPASDGVYLIHGVVGIRGSTAPGDRLQARLQNVTDGTLPVSRPMENASAPNSIPSYNILADLTGGKTYELQVRNRDNSFVVSQFDTEAEITRV